MKRIISYSIAFILSMLVFYACNKSNPTSPPPNSSPDLVISDTGYFPNVDQTYYKYNVDRTDSTGTMYNGTRSTTYSGTGTQNGITYQRQIDTLSIQGQTNVGISYFRKTNTEVFYFLDTTGFSEVIPDSLKPLITFSPTNFEMGILFLNPDIVSSPQPIFSMMLNIFGTSINIVNLQAYYLGPDSVTLNLNTGTVTKAAEKIKYEFKLTLNPPSPAVTYDAYAWVVKNIGFVKWEGNGVIINAFTGGGIDFADTTSSVTMNLTQYSLK